MIGSVQFLAGFWFSLENNTIYKLAFISFSYDFMMFCNSWNCRSKNILIISKYLKKTRLWILGAAQLLYNPLLRNCMYYRRIYECIVICIYVLRIYIFHFNLILNISRVKKNENLKKGWWNVIFLRRKKIYTPVQIRLLFFTFLDNICIPSCGMWVLCLIKRLNSIERGDGDEKRNKFKEMVQFLQQLENKSIKLALACFSFDISLCQSKWSLQGLS